MTRERAQFWMTVVVLICAALIVGQKEAVAVAAMIGACLAYLEMKPPGPP